MDMYVNMCGAIDSIMSCINDNTNLIDEIIHKTCEMNNNILHRVDDKINEIVTQSKRKIRLILVYQT